MLNNHLISTLKSYSLIFVLLTACATKSKKDKIDSRCHYDQSNIEKRHIVKSAQSRTIALSRCLKNYLKFQEDKKVNFQLCNKLNVSKLGKVTYGKTFSLQGSLPKDLQMCIEQEYWQMDFSRLQLSDQHTVNFPISLISK